MDLKAIYIVGSGGHSRSIQSLLDNRELPIVTIGPEAAVEEEVFLSQKLFESRILNGIGFYQNSLNIRIKTYNRYKSDGFNFENLVASSAIVKTSTNCAGLQIFEQVYIGPNVSFGDNVVVNTAAVVEHDCVIEDSCFISPGALVLGSARIGEGAFIGAGAIIFPKVSISKGVVIPAGTVVSKDT